MKSFTHNFLRLAASTIAHLAGPLAERELDVNLYVWAVREQGIFPEMLYECY